MRIPAFCLLALLAGGALLPLPPALASTVGADFNDNAPGALGSATAGAGQGGGTGWLAGDGWGNTGTIAVVAGDLAAPAGTNHAIPQTGTPQSVQGNFAQGRMATRVPEVPLAGTIWFSFLLNQPTADSRGGLAFNQNSAAPGDPRIVATGTDLRIGLTLLQGAGAGANGVFTLGETALVLGRLVINTAGDEVLDVWVNPDVSLGADNLGVPTNTIAQDQASFDGGLARVGVQSYSADGAGGIVDALILSDASNAFEVVTTGAMPAEDDPNLAAGAGNPFAGLFLNPDPAPITRTVTVTNTGLSNTLTLADTSALVTGAPNFVLLTALPIDLAPSASTVLEIQFDAGGGSGIFTGQLDLRSNDPGQPSVLVPLAVTVPAGGVNLLANADFEADMVAVPGWQTTAAGASAVPGIAPGSATAATIPPFGALFQDVLAARDWFADFYFQAPDTFDRAFNVVLIAPTGRINIRYQGTSAGAENTWNAYDDVPASVNDLWGSDLGLGAVTPGARYFMRIVGHDWGGPAPTYDLLLSEANSLALTRSVPGLSRFQAGIVTSPPTSLRFSAENGNAPGFILDDVRFVNGTAPAEDPLAITGFAYDALAATVTLRWRARPGVTYFIDTSDDLVVWQELEDRVAAGTEEELTETGVPPGARYYRVTE